MKLPNLGIVVPIAAATGIGLLRRGSWAATATNVGAAFYAVGLIILPTLAFVGLVTFDRALQSGIEDHGYARRIARLRGYYFANAPELTGYLLSVPPAERLRIQGLQGGQWPIGLAQGSMVETRRIVSRSTLRPLLRS